MDVVKPRESLFRFSGMRTRMADDPAQALEHLFQYYVERLFAQHKEMQDIDTIRDFARAD